MRLTRSTVGNQNGLDWKAATRAWENWASQASGLRVGQFLTGAGGGQEESSSPVQNLHLFRPLPSMKIGGNGKRKERSSTR